MLQLQLQLQLTGQYRTSKRQVRSARVPTSSLRCAVRERLSSNDADVSPTVSAALTLYTFCVHFLTLFFKLPNKSAHVKAIIHTALPDASQEIQLFHQTALQ